MAELTPAQARLIFLDSQALRLKHRRWKGQAGLVDCVKHLGYVQIDTISAVQRAHHHVFWTRVGGYNPEMINRAQADKRRIFEYWSHAASFLPMDDFRYSLPRKRHLRDKWRAGWSQDHMKVQRFVLDRIKAEGELSAREFEAPPDWKSGNWFDWKPAKSALENLFHTGDLMISKRVGFQKYFDLPERVVPSRIQIEFPTEQEQIRHLILTTLRAHGLASASEMSYLRKMARATLNNVLRELQESGDISAVRIHGIEDEYYALPSTLSNLPARPGHARLRILSPFDNLVIQRKKLQRLFNFDYTIECYVPAPKRQFGYFCLPLLYKSNIIGRLDAKAARAERVLIVKSLWLEHPERADGHLAASLAEELRDFADFNGCDDIKLEDCNDTSLKKALSRSLK